MSIKKIYFLLVVVLLIFLGVVSSALESANIRKNSFNLYEEPSPTLLESNPRISDLYSIVVALNKFKNDHQQYPISRDNGKGWSSMYNGDQLTVSWIVGLTPVYMDFLPIDPRESDDRMAQYAYQSDGANYKVVSFYPPDCAEVHSVNPRLVVPAGNKCLGYGLWTERAVWSSFIK